jgi:sulfopyruvate decarboxylase alpha subunit
MDWAEITLDRLRRQDVRLVTYVPDGALAKLIQGFESDSAVECFTATREDEAVAIACGSAMGGVRSVTLMQSSGFGNIANALASLATPYQIPVLMIITERGVLGEFNPVQTPITRVLRSTLDGLGIPHVTLDDINKVEFLVDRMASQCFNAQQPAALIVSPLLTGGKTSPGSAPSKRAA